jgi:hypothetical protein
VKGLILPASSVAVSRRANLALPLFCLAAVVANQAVFRLGVMSALWTVALLLTLAGLYWFAADITTSADARAPLRATNLLVAALALAPLCADLAIGWNREFPFSGDSYFHVGQSFRIAFWWLSPVASAVVKVPTLDDVRNLLARPWLLLVSRVVALALVAVATAVLYRRRREVALAFAVVAIVAWGCAEATIFLRYPGARYLVDLPFLGLAWGVNDLELAGRLSNVGAALCWLLVLRPWLVGRWPDLRILPVAVLLLWQKDVIHYFDSVYLEPWGVVFSLLAAELLVAKGREGASVACLCIGAAAAVKEPFILALPFVWLAGEPWRLKRPEFVRLFAAGVAAGMPFVLYVAARKSIDIADLGSDRSVHFSMSMDGLQHYGSEFAKQMLVAFPGASGILAAAMLVAVAVAFVTYPERRVALVCLTAAGCFVALFFATDTFSQRWAGYFRFLLYSLPFLTSGLMLLSQSLRPGQALATVAAVAVLQAPSAYTALARAAGPASGRNFVEHYDSPIVFPIKSLIAEARRAGALPPRAPILANSIDNTLRSFPGSDITYGPVGELYCSCEPDHPNVLALFIRFTNMSRFLATRDQPPDSRFGIWQRTDAQAPACLAQIERSCGHVFARVEGGTLVGVLGTRR